MLAVAIAFMCVSCSGANTNTTNSQKASAPLVNAGTERFKYSFLDVFDTASTVIAYDASQEAFDEHMDMLHTELLRYDHLYDIYNSYDGMVNMHTLNTIAKDGPVEVDPDIIELLVYCKKVYEMSKHQTNIAFGSVLVEWHYCREAGMDNPNGGELPDMDKLKKASEHTSIDDLIIDEEKNTVYYADPELRLDVGAVAKGFAVNKVTEYAKKNLWSSAAISIGGNVSTFGYKNNDGSTLWKIGIENPDRESSEYLDTVNVTDISIVTSGDYQRYYMVDGKKYCHIINTETLMPSRYFTGVTVLCKDSARGDALSTTLFNLPLDEGMALVESMDEVEAVWVDTEYNKTYSSGYEQYLA